MILIPNYPCYVSFFYLCLSCFFIFNNAELNKDIPIHEAKKIIHDEKIISCIISDTQECEYLYKIDSDITIFKKEFLNGLNLNLNALDLINQLNSNCNKINFIDELFIMENKIDNYSKIKIFRVSSFYGLLEVPYMTLFSDYYAVHGFRSL